MYHTTWNASRIAAAAMGAAVAAARHFELGYVLQAGHAEPKIPPAA